MSQAAAAAAVFATGVTFGLASESPFSNLVKASHKVRMSDNDQGCFLMPH